MRTATLLSSMFGASLLCMSTGCLNSADKITHTLVPSALDSSIDFFEVPNNQARLRKLMASPEIQAAIGEMVDAIVGGALESGTDDERMAKVRDVSTKYIAAITKSVADGLQNDLGPAASQSANQLVAGLLDTALSPKARREASQMVDSVTRSLVASLSQSASAGLRDDLGPAIAEVLREDLGPALQDVIANDLKPVLDGALGGVMPSMNEATRGLTKAAIMGMGDALEDPEFQAKLMRFSDKMFNRPDSAVNKGITLSTIVAIGLGLLVLVLALLVTRVFLARRRIEKERAHSERMLLLVVQAMQGAKGKPEVEALLRQIHERETELADEGFLDELSRRVRGTPAGSARRAA